MSIKVFVSHQRVDTALASHLANRLRRDHQIDSYLDAWDKEIGKSGDDLAQHVKSQLDKCTQLLAVVSSATKESWWVPWEIGLATEKDYPLATFGSGVALPEFLRKWPYLRTEAELDVYAVASKLANQQYDRRRQLNESVTAARRTTTKDFHRDLRFKLNQ